MLESQRCSDTMKRMFIYTNYWLVQYTEWRAHPPMVGVTTSKNVSCMEMQFVIFNGTVVTHFFSSYAPDCITETMH